MQYRIYKFAFAGGVHFGSGVLEKSEVTFFADTLCSALFQEAFKKGESTGRQLFEQIKSSMLALSDAFPYVGNEYYLPKPFVRIKTSENEGDSAAKKAFKKLKYIPAAELETFLSGNFEPRRKRGIDRLGFSEIKVSASVRKEGDTLPYRVGTYYFGKGSGLYSIVGYENEDVLDFAENLLISLSYSGIGGKRMAGLGRFELYYGELPDEIAERLASDGKSYMSLSVSLPRESELEQALQGARYQLIRRGGFAASPVYSAEQKRKRDLYMLTAGSTFANRFDGDIYDVSDGGNHPVYRYGRPMLLKIS